MSKLKQKGLHLNSSLTANAIITNKEIYGADHIVIEGAGSIIADTVMNDIFYPKSEVIALANRTKSDLHAPSGHPVDEDGNFISASHPMATQQNFIGGISNNYRMNGDRLVRDIAINPEIANRFDDGKEIIRRIKEKEDTDTSTGLLLQLEEKSGIGNDGEPYKFIARNMELDHDAILLRERGAATSLQGVGMFANSKGDEFKVDEYTINASLPAMNLPLASSDHVWNESQALSRIKAFTNSEDKPSSNFRRFFLNFDQSNVDSFDSYTNLFADVIDGVPHAVKSPIEAATNSTSAQAYNKRFAGNKDGVFSKAWNVIKSFISNGKHGLSHNDIEDKIHKKLNEGRTDRMPHLWPFRFFETKFVYPGDNDTMLMQSFALVDDEVVFIGEPIEVEHVEDFIPVTNGGNMLTNGAKLSARLESLLDKKSGGDSEERSNLIDQMASSAGIARDTTLAILAGDIDVPPDNRLEGFAKALGVSFESLKSLVPKEQTNGDRIMREKIIKALNAANVKIEDLDDDAIFAEFEKLGNKGDDKNLTEEEILKRKKAKGKKSEHNGLTLEDVTTAVNAAIKPLQEQLAANANKELDTLVDQVKKLDIGINKDAAKLMGVNSCKDILAKNGVAAFNSAGGYIRHNNSEDGCSTLTLPSSDKGA